MSVALSSVFLAGVLLFPVSYSWADKAGKAPNPETTKNAANSSTGLQIARPPVTDLPVAWQDAVIKAIAGGGLPLVSLSFAAFTFLYGALLGLREENRLDPRIRTFKRKLAGAIYGTALAVGCASTLVVLVFVSLVSGSRSAAYATMSLAVVILFGLSTIACNLALDLYKARKRLPSS